MNTRLVAIRPDSTMDVHSVHQVRTHLWDHPIDGVFLGFNEPYSTLRKFFSPTNAPYQPATTFTTALDSIVMTPEMNELVKNDKARICDIKNIKGLDEKIDLILNKMAKVRYEKPMIFGNLIMVNAIASLILGKEQLILPLIRPGNVIWPIYGTKKKAF